MLRSGQTAPSSVLARIGNEMDVESIMDALEEEIETCGCSEIMNTHQGRLDR